MQKPMYPSKIIRITQRHGIGSHKRNFAFDEASLDGGISGLGAPFTGVIKKIYPQDANEVWLESKEPVAYPDGTIDYMTILFAHCNDVSHLHVGQVIEQGEIFYYEGTKGQATGNHCHIECGKGKFNGTGWHNDNGSWDINNGKCVEECLWIDDSYTIKELAGYNFRNVKETEVKKLGTPVERNELLEQVKVFNETTVLRARNAPNGEVLGYINPGIYNILEKDSAGDYEWFRVETDLWFAFSEEWMEVLEVKKNDSAEELQTTADKLQKELAAKEEMINNLSAGVTELTNTIIDKDKEISALKEQLAIAPKLIFESTKLDYYAIKLDENQKLYLG